MSETLVSAHDGEATGNRADVAAVDYQTCPAYSQSRCWILPRRAAWRGEPCCSTSVPTRRSSTQASPLKQGFYTLLLILGVVIVARLVGWGLDYLTSPRLESLQTLLQNFITGLPWYADTGPASRREFATQFAQSYWLSWEGVRLRLGIPTPTNQGIGIGALVLDTLLAWLVFGTVAHWMARWFGGTGTLEADLGAMALAYAPLLLLVVEAVPGAYVPLTLLFLAMLVGKYQAVKSAHGLRPATRWPASCCRT